MSQVTPVVRRFPGRADRPVVRLWVWVTLLVMTMLVMTMLVSCTALPAEWPHERGNPALAGFNPSETVISGANVAGLVELWRSGTGHKAAL